MIKTIKKTLAFLLSLCLILSAIILPITVSAAGTPSKMIHLKVGAYSDTAILALKINTDHMGNYYGQNLTLKFKYKMVTGMDDITVWNAMITEDGHGYMHKTNMLMGSAENTSDKFYEKTVTFNYSVAEKVNANFLEFRLHGWRQSAGSTEMYIADISLTAADGTELLLPVNDYTDLYYLQEAKPEDSGTKFNKLDNDVILDSNTFIKLENYNENVFVDENYVEPETEEPARRMLHVVAPSHRNALTVAFKVKNVDMTKYNGQDLTLKFKYKMVNGGALNDGDIAVMITEDGHKTRTKYLTISSEDSSNEYFEKTVTFNYSKSSGGNLDFSNGFIEFRVHNWRETTHEFYIGDFSLATADGTELISELTTHSNYFYSLDKEPVAYSNLSTDLNNDDGRKVELLNYNDELFAKFVERKTLHAITTTQNTLILSQPIDKDIFNNSDKFVLRFKYKKTKGLFDNEIHAMVTPYNHNYSLGKVDLTLDNDYSNDVWSEKVVVFSRQGKSIDNPHFDFQLTGAVDIYLADLSLCVVGSDENLLKGFTGYADLKFKMCGDSGTYWAQPQEFTKETLSGNGYDVSFEKYNKEFFKLGNKIVNYGDVNYDGNIDILDLVKFKKNIVNNTYYVANADLSKDGKINDVEDLMLLRKVLLGCVTVGPEKYASLIDSFKGQSGGSDVEAYIMKNDINANKDTLEQKNVGTIYKVSKDGPIKTIADVNALNLVAGDTVLFNRGEIFRTTEGLKIVSGVNYGAYGSGARPEILGSAKDYADASLWVETSTANVWKMTEQVNEVGNIFMDNGSKAGCRKYDLASLKNSGDYYYDINTKYVYMMFSNYNPGTWCDNIELSSCKNLVYSGNRISNVKIENLTVKYTARHGISLNNSTNVEITGCEIAYIGGATYKEENGSKTVRMGNGIEFWVNTSDCSVANNYIYNVYDAAVSFQGKTNEANNYTNIDINNNLIEYTSFNFEFWACDKNDLTANVIIEGIKLSNNIMRFSGYGFGGLQRPDLGSQAFILGWNYEYDNGLEISITNNIFDISKYSFVYMNNSMLDFVAFSGNTYYQNTSVDFIYNSNNKVKDQNSFESIVAVFDKNAKVVWMG